MKRVTFVVLSLIVCSLTSFADVGTVEAYKAGMTRDLNQLDDVGDILSTIFAPVPGASGVSVAVDCEGNLYYTNYLEAFLHKMDAAGVLISSTPTVDQSGVSTYFDELAWDNTRQLLWTANASDVYLLDPATGIGTFQWVGQAGIPLTDGIAFDGTDGTVWHSTDISSDIAHFTDAGLLLGTLTPLDAGGSPDGSISGITVGTSNRMYVGHNGLGYITVVDKTTGVFQSTFAVPGGRDEGLECDPVNFAPVLALWTKGAYDNSFTAFEVETGSCACGGGGCVPLCELVEDPCEIPVGCYRTQTQGGWGQDRCNSTNPGCTLAAWFATCFPAGLVVGGDYTLTLTSAAAVAAFLPQGKTPGVLDMNYVDPVNPVHGSAATSAGVFAGQVVTLAINVGFGDCGVTGFADIGPLVIAYGWFAGWTVDELLELANEVLGGDLTNLPDGVSISDLNGAVTSVNQTFTDGSISSGYLVDPCCELDGFRRSAPPSEDVIGNPGEGSTPDEDALVLKNYPNPFNPSTTISYEVAEAGLVTLTVFNLMGQEIATLVHGNVDAGVHQATFNGAALPSGLYIYRLETAGQTLQHKMLLMK